MQEYDVAIVGGGPVGGHVAERIAEKNFNVAVFEKNKHIGLPLSCAGLITPKVFEFLDFKKELVLQNIIKGANIHSPSGHVLSIGGNKIHALVIDRTKFDKEIINKAEEKGANIFVENKVLAIQKNKGHVELKTSQKNDIKCKLLIGADGPYSMVRDRFLFSEPAEFLRGVGAEVTDVSLDPNFVEIFVGKNVAPGFFAWAIPTNKDGTEARIGLCVDEKAPNAPKHYFTNFLKNKQMSKFLKDVKITKNIGGIVPLGMLKKTYQNNVMLVGDAAAQVKPTSGGGIYPGLLCACHCSSIALDALKKEKFTANFLKKYHKFCTADIGRELFLGMKFRKVYKSLTDKQFDKYIERFNNPKISEVIEKYGDIDYPSKLVKPLIKKAPTLLKLIPKMIKE